MLGALFAPVAGEVAFVLEALGVLAVGVALVAEGFLLLALALLGVLLDLLGVYVLPALLLGVLLLPTLVGVFAAVLELVLGVLLGVLFILGELVLGFFAIEELLAPLPAPLLAVLGVLLGVLFVDEDAVAFFVIVLGALLAVLGPLLPLLAVLGVLLAAAPLLAVLGVLFEDAVFEDTAPFDAPLPVLFDGANFAALLLLLPFLVMEEALVAEAFEGVFDPLLLAGVLLVLLGPAEIGGRSAKLPRFWAFAAPTLGLEAVELLRATGALFATALPDAVLLPDDAPDGPTVFFTALDLPLVISILVFGLAPLF